MATTIVNVADAIVTTLNDAPQGTFSQSFTAQRKVLVEFRLGEMGEDVHVTVVPSATAIAETGRSASQYDYQVDVGVQKRLDDIEAEVPGLCRLVEEILAYLRAAPLVGLSSAHFLDAANDPVCYQAHLAEMRLFTSVLSVTYRMVKEA